MHASYKVIKYIYVALVEMQVRQARVYKKNHT